MLPVCKELLLELDTGVLHVTLNRPHKRNAMNSLLVQELIDVVRSIADDRTVRVIVLRGAEGNFCAGGDISGMNQEGQAGKEASWEFNRSFGTMIAALNRAPQLVICLLEGAVLGGGFGLACVSDLAIADEQSMFAMPETGLGIIPAQIAPFVVARVGITQARQLALFGKRINGKEAQQIGVAHEVVNGPEELDKALAFALKLASKAAPNATAATKSLLLDVDETLVIESILDRAADDFTAAITSEEGLEGTRAFVEKRNPAWAAKQP
ncbi:MAG: enoyl-CoA hydratase-related protein [Pseudomonadota bacterium]